MPKLNGYEASVEIRDWLKQTSFTKKIRIVMLTADANYVVRKNGCDALIVKPITLGKLREIVS